jgi:GT2 family glycosyltransferase
VEASLISPTSPRAGGSSTGAAALIPPAAVGIVDLEAPLADLELSPSSLGEPYRSLMVVARLNGEPLGTASVPVTESRVSRRRLADALMSQLEAELDKACARRGVVLPKSLVGGIAVGRYGDVTPPASRSVSVVVTTCRNTARLERCLRSILASRYSRLDVIVVENRPGTGATRRLLSERFAGEVRVRYVEESRPGLSWARNAGLAAAEGELVAFTDDDVVVDPEWVHRAVRAFDRAPDVACVTGLILPSHLETDSRLILEQFAAFSKGFDARVFRLPDAREEHPLLPHTPGLIGSGANIVVRADVAHGVGGFDTGLGTGTPAAGGEDLDLYIRLLRGGHAVAYEPSAIVWHEHPDGSFRLRRQVFRHGVRLGATLTKQLARGPERLELLRSVPAGVRYAREPSSHKNAGKTDDYPRSLKWLERVSTLLGPAAYLASSAMRWLRRRKGLGVGSDASASAMHVHRVALSSGRSVDVVSFLDLGRARPATADRPLVETGASTGASIGAATLVRAAPRGWATAAADAGRGAILVVAAASLLAGDGDAALGALLVLLAAVAARLVGVAPVFDLVFVVALAGEAIATALGAYDPLSWGDTLSHLALPLLSGPVVYVGLARLVGAEPGAPRRLSGVIAAALVTAVSVFCLGVAWELVEWTADDTFGTNYSQGYTDTLRDLRNDAIGAAAGGILVALWLWSAPRGIGGVPGRRMESAP